MQISVADGGAGDHVQVGAEDASGSIDHGVDGGPSLRVEDDDSSDELPETEFDDDVFKNPSALKKMKRSAQLPKSSSTASSASVRSLDRILKASSGS